jgi:hypothetical protein
MAKKVWESVQGNAIWDVIKEGAKLMLPFLAGWGVKEWVTLHAIGLMWLAAFGVALLIAFVDRIVPKRSALANAPIAAQGRQPAREPHLLINYSGGLEQKLTFINDGETTAIIKAIGPLSWEEHRLITLWGPISPIPAGGREECQMWFDRSPNNGYELYQFMRESTPHDADTYVILSFEDSQGNAFNQRFSLTTTSHSGTMVWQPGPVKRVSAEVAL